jgi:hypothetical protein
MDIIFIVLIAALAAATFALVLGCERLRDRDQKK